VRKNASLAQTILHLRMDNRTNVVEAAKHFWILNPLAVESRGGKKVRA